MIFMLSQLTFQDAEVVGAGESRPSTNIISAVIEGGATDGDGRTITAAQEAARPSTQQSSKANVGQVSELDQGHDTKSSMTPSLSPSKPVQPSPERQAPEQSSSIKNKRKSGSRAVGHTTPSQRKETPIEDDAETAEPSPTKKNKKSEDKHHNSKTSKS